MSLTNLESKKLLLDLKYWKEELEIKKEMLQSLDSNFSKALNEYLNNNPDLQKRWDDMNKKEEERIDNIIKQKEEELKKHQENKDSDIPESESEDEPISEDDEEKEEERKVGFTKTGKPPFFKKIYRDIAKRTHPDKFPNLPEDALEKKKEQYKKATKFYEEEKYGDLLYIAYELGIEFDIQEENLIHLRKTLGDYKKDSEFIEGTYTWKWHHSNQQIKEALIRNFIMDKLS